MANLVLHIEHPAAAALRGALRAQDAFLADAEGLLARVAEYLDRMVVSGFDW